MKFFRITVILACLATLLFSSCNKMEEMSDSGQDYGYVQFKLYKEGQDLVSKAVTNKLNYLADATKLRVTMSYNGVDIYQTLNLTSSSEELAEFGLRSDKLKLLAGEYKIIGFVLYDRLDEELYRGTPGQAVFTITPGGLVSHNLFAKAVMRGNARISFTKDLSSFENNPATKAPSREYLFSDIEYVDIGLKNIDDGKATTIYNLPVKHSVHFDDDDQTYGYQTSSLICDTLLSLTAGTHQVVRYVTKNSDKKILETNTNPLKSEFEIENNRTTDVKVALTLYESDEYIKDYYALYAIWEALDGPNWYFFGENELRGCNWDFNKDPDLWGQQPGVTLHANGRVASITISEFGFSGKIPAEIGQLTELRDLYLGTHNDTYLIYPDPTLLPGLTDANRMERHKEYLSKLHTPTQFSEPIARALKEHNISIPEISLYEKYTENEIMDGKGGMSKMAIQPMDIVYGRLCNGLTEIDPAIGNLKNLKRINIANGKIADLPDEFANLTGLTDLELYNCSYMTSLPEAIGNLPNLVSVNLSNNGWSEEESLKAFNLIANGQSKDDIQILYFRQNKLPEIPASIKNMTRIGLLDLAYNRIKKTVAFGDDINLIQAYFDFNQLESFPTENGIFCGFDDIETFSAKGNKLTKFPDIFSSKSKFTMLTVDFSYNNISEIENAGNGYKGLNVETLSMTNNPLLTEYPKAFAESGSQINYINLRGCSISSFPKGCFVGEKMAFMISMDLSYNHISELPKEFDATNIPYLYGMELSYNRFSSFPIQPLDMSGLTVFAIRGQRDENGKRCLKQWPTGIYQHTGLRGLYLGSNDLRKVDDTISHLIYYLEISDNPNIEFDASDICYYYAAGAYILIYDKTQKILNCEYM